MYRVRVLKWLLVSGIICASELSCTDGQEWLRCFENINHFSDGIHAMVSGRVISLVPMKQLLGIEGVDTVSVSGCLG